MAAKNNKKWRRITVGETWIRVFLFCKRARCYYDTEPTQDCFYLWYRSIATKREMIRFTTVPASRRESRLFNDFIILHKLNPIWNLRKQVPIQHTSPVHTTHHLNPHTSLGHAMLCKKALSKTMAGADTGFSKRGG